MTLAAPNHIVGAKDTYGYTGSVPAATAKAAPVSLAEPGLGFFVAPDDPPGSRCLIRQVLVQNPVGAAASIFVGGEYGAFEEVVAGASTTRVVTELGLVWIANPSVGDLAFNVTLWFNERQA